MSELRMSAEEYERLKQRLEELERQRQKVAEEIAAARSQRDLSENAAYHAAKEKQAFLEGEIASIMRRIKQARVIEGSSEGVRAGSRVRLLELSKGKQLKLLVVSDLSLAPEEGPIPVSVGSPLGKALLGKRAGEEIKVQTPQGLQSYKILEVL